MRTKWFLALALALGCFVITATAQDGAAPAEPAPAAEESVEVVDLETGDAAAAAEEGVAITPIDVWWGNRSISYGNYIKFDRFAGECDHWCPVCAARNICCPNGCPCTDGCTCCANRWDKIFFDQNKAFLRADAVQELQRVLEYLQRNPTMGVNVQGLANDSDSQSRNQGLADKRAEAVKNWLVSNGIEPMRIQTSGTGTLPSGSTQDRIFGRRAIVETRK